MKNIKTLATTLGLAGIMAISSVSANAGLMMSDRTANTGSDTTTTTQCTQQTGIFDQVLGTILLRYGLMMSDRAVNCQNQASRDGLMMSD